MSHKHYIIPIFVPHEGCPHDCVFCNQDSITGSREVIDDVYVRTTINEYFKTIDRCGSTIEVSFFGGTFTAIPIAKQRQLLSVAKEYKDLNMVHFIRLSTRPDYIDDEILSHLKSFSVDIIELGVQSMDREVLVRSGRGHTAEDVTYASRLIKQYGFVLGHQVMLGLPGDTPEKDVQTVNTLIDLKPDIFRIYPALVIKDTPMEILYRNKRYDPYSLREAIDVTKDIYALLLFNHIKVIRVGLQASDNINSDGDIVAGPFHPAFRELVEGSLYCDMITDAVKNMSGNVEVHINEKDISKLYANRKEFFIDMKKQLNTLNLRVTVDNTIERGALNLENDEMCYKLSINDYIEKKVKEGKINVP